MGDGHGLAGGSRVVAAARKADAPARAPGGGGTGVSVDVVAGLFGLTPRRIQQLVKEGVLPRGERGRYNLAACVRAYVAFLQLKLHEAQSSQRSSARDALAEDKALKVRAERELVEMKVQERRAQLVPSADVRWQMERLCGTLRSRVLGVRGRWAPRILGLGTMPDATRVLDELANDVLEALRSAGDELESDEAGDEEPPPGAEVAA